jgi:hypothetical protein
MSDSAHDMQSALAFFRAGIFDRALEYHKGADPGRIIADLGLMEAADWALLGTWIGYFDARQALELVSSARESILHAWSRLLKQELVSPRGDLGRIVDFEEEGPILSAKSFIPVGDMDSGERDLLQDTFQTILLLTTEHVWTDEAMYFVDSISWTDSDEWSARKNASVQTPFRSAQRIATGFADVLLYWREIHSLVAPIFDGTSPLPDSDRASVVLFVERARGVLLPRFHLNREVVRRYFGLAGEYVNLNTSGSPAWLDGRRDAFDNLMLLIRYIAGNRFPDTPSDLWNLYAHPIEASRLQRRIDPEGVDE